MITDKSRAMPCWIYRKQLQEAAANSAPLSAAARRHVQSCACCGEEFALQSALTRRLVREAKQQAEEAPAFLASRVMAAARASRHSAPEPAFPAWPRLASFAGMAALGALALFLTLPKPPPLAPSPVALQPAMADEEISPALTQWAAKINNPLQTEMERVASDARNAMQLLAHNFLPARPASAGEEGSQN